MIKIDGKQYDVPITELGLDVEFQYKFAERNEKYELNYELGAVFYNQSITFATTDTTNKDFVALVQLLSTKSSIDDGKHSDPFRRQFYPSRKCCIVYSRSGYSKNCDHAIIKNFLFFCW